MLSKTISTNRSASFFVNSAAFATSFTRSALVMKSPRSKESPVVRYPGELTAKHRYKIRARWELHYQKQAQTARLKLLRSQYVTVREKPAGLHGHKQHRLPVGFSRRCSLRRSCWGYQSRPTRPANPCRRRL